jgi:hypothetical protein
MEGGHNSRGNEAGGRERRDGWERERNEKGGDGRREGE